VSRDREGAVCSRFRDKYRHRLSLLLDNISDRCGNIVPIQQPPRATMPRPSLSIRPVRAGLVQSPARIRFEIVHYSFRLGFSFDNNMNVVRSYMGCEKRPLAMRTHLLNRTKYCCAAERVKYVRSLVHKIPLVRYPLRVGFHHTMSRNVVVPIHGTGFVAVQMRTVAGERNQVCHRRPFYTAPSRSRLIRVRSRLTSVLNRAVTIRERFITFSVHVPHYKDNSLQ
jgi:hypothetical protein